MVGRTRALAIVGVLLVLLVAGVALSFTYPFGLEEQPDVPGEEVAPSVDASAAMTAQVSTRMPDDREATTIDSELVANETAVRYRYTHDRQTERRTEERYYGPDGGWHSTRLSTDDQDVMDSWIGAAEESAVVDQYERDGEHVLVKNSADAEGDVESRVRSFYSRSGTRPSLDYPAYEERGERTFAGRSATVYEPRDGWFESPTASHPFHYYRVTDATGDIYVDTETGALLYADVSYTVVEASNYAEYVRESAIRGDAIEVEVRYEFDDEVDELEQPAWAERPD